MLGLLQGGEAVALIMEPTPIAQAMRQTAMAPAQPCLCERRANSVTLQKLALTPSLSVCEHVVESVCDRERRKITRKTVGFAFVFNIVRICMHGESNILTLWSKN